MSVKNNITFYVRNNQGFPVACVNVVRASGKGANVGISVYNPKDRFSKAVARKVAAGRANALNDFIHHAPESAFYFRDNAVWCRDLEDFSSENVFDKVKDIISSACNNGNMELPNRVKNALVKPNKK